MHSKFLGRFFLIGWIILTCTACGSPTLSSLFRGTSSSLSPQPFSHDGGWYTFTTWSPNGHWLAAPLDHSGDLVCLYTPERQVVGNWHSDCGVDGVFYTIAWLPDGRISCFYGGTGNASLVWIATLNQKGQEISHTEIPVPVPPVDDFIFALQWNPQHFWLATLAGTGGPQAFVYLSDLQGHLLLPPIPVAGDGNVAWSPDGTTLAIVEQQGIVLVTVQPTRDGKLAVKSQRTLTVGTPLDDTLSWSPSGHWLVCRHQTYEGDDYLFLLATDGSGKRVQITSSDQVGQLFNPAWSPDGKQLIMTRVGDWSLFSLDMDALLQQKKLTP